MRNFYFVSTFNIHHPRVRYLLDAMKLNMFSESIHQFKAQSKLYISFSEAGSAAHADFDKKANSLFPDAKSNEEKEVRVFSMMNPAMVMEEPDGPDDIWDENCCGVIFFSDGEECEDDAQLADNWMFKYEIFFSEDEIEMVKNGQMLFPPHDVPFINFSSALN